MAKSMWGKQPPKKDEYVPPELGTPNFWGPAPVPPKVYQTWEEVWGEGRDGTSTETTGKEEEGTGGSWVSKFSKRFASAPVIIAGEGRDGTSTETAGKDEAGTATEAGSTENAGAGTSNIAGEGRDGTSTETAGKEDSSTPVNIAGEGRDGSSGFTLGFSFGTHDSWVNNFEKSLAQGTAGNYDPSVRQQGAGAHDSWVSKFSQHFASAPLGVKPGAVASGSYMASPVKKPKITPFSSKMGTGRKDDPAKKTKSVDAGAHDSWVKAFKKKNEPGKGTSWLAPVKQEAAPSQSKFTSAKPKKGKGPSDRFVGQWNFRVFVDGIPDDNCKLLSVSGISSETEPIEFKRSTRQYVEAFPGKYKFSNVELTKVLNIGGDSFAKWRDEIEAGDNSMRTVTVHLHHIDLKGSPVMKITLHDAWPVKWEFPELNGSSSDAAVEKITLNVGRITRS